MSQLATSPIRLTAEGDTPTFKTITGVEIAHVGMDWPASTGTVTLTMQHLADAVEAENNDPHILPPRLKIGHVDPRFNEDPPVADPFAYHGPLRQDGNPVYGKATNLRLAEDGMVLVGDYVEVPAWLSDAMPSAYPSRSLEGDFNVKTDAGRTYSFVITAVALLGEPLPAISCLDDLVRELSGGPAAVAAQTPVTLQKGETMPVAAEASADAVRSQFLDEVAIGDRYWWWPIEVRVDQGWVLADDDEGHLFRVPFTTDADGNVSYGDPVQGVLDFREVPDTETNEAGQPVAASRVVRFARPQSRVRAAHPNQEGAEMTNVSTALLETLGITPEMTEEEQLAALASYRGDDNPTPEPEAEGDTPAVEPETLPVAASVDPAALAQLQEDARLGREAREQQLRMEREQLVDEKIKGGFITSASRAANLAELNKGGEFEKAHRAHLARLTSVIVPVGERGIAPADNARDDATHESIMASFGVRQPAGRER